MTDSPTPNTPPGETLGPAAAFWANVKKPEAPPQQGEVEAAVESGKYSLGVAERSRADGRWATLPTKDLRTLLSALTASQAREARADDELSAVSAALGGDARFMDPPDGGDVPLSEQVRRCRTALDEAEAREARAAEALAWEESFIADEEDGPVVGILIGLPDGSQIWTGECSNALLQEAVARNESPDESGLFLMIAAKGKSTRVVAQIATTDDGIALARAVALAHGPNPAPDASAVRDLLRRFRDLHAKNDPDVRSHHHPIWAEVAAALSQGEA